MYKVEAVIQPFRLTEVQRALVGDGVRGMTVTEIKGFAQDEWHTEHYRGADYRIDLERRLMIRVVVPENRILNVMKVIQGVNNTDKNAEGSICVSRVEDLMTIRTGQIGREAI